MFTRPHPYPRTPPADPAIYADDVRGNHEAARAYLNGGIVAGDLVAGSVDFTKILAGEYAWVSPGDHRFTTGNQASIFFDADPSRWSALSRSMKSAGGDADLFVPVVARRVWCGFQHGIGLVTAFLHVFPQVNVVNSAIEGEADDAYLYIDGEQVADSIAPFSAEDETVSSDFDGSGFSRRRTATLHALVDGLTVGWHVFELRVHPRHDLSLVLTRALDIEIFEV